jgi:hypothetical protein
MAAVQAPTAEEFADWLEPRQALALVTKDVGTAGVARGKLVDRLKAGLIRSYAGTAISRRLGEESRKTQFEEISPGWWRRHEHHYDDLWQSGDLTWETHDAGYGQEITYLDIRLDPQGVGALLPKPKPAPPTLSPPPPSTGESTEPEAKGPPVSPAALEAWCTAYQLAYQGPEDTLAKAYDSAEGMFPGKFVARQRIRDLLKGRKRGRKSK